MAGQRGPTWDVWFPGTWNRRWAQARIGHVVAGWVLFGDGVEGCIEYSPAGLAGASFPKDKRPCFQANEKDKETEDVLSMLDGVSGQQRLPCGPCGWSSGRGIWDASSASGSQRLQEQAKSAGVGT